MTISTADALDVLTIVAACHRKTAPKLDDKAAAFATAGIWAELFNAHDLQQPDLIAAVKLRAQHAADAPEPAEIIEFARKIRQQRDSDHGPTPEYEALCESKAEDADELERNRQQRASTPIGQRPKLSELVASFAAQKAID